MDQQDHDQAGSGGLSETTRKWVQSGVVIQAVWGLIYLSWSFLSLIAAHTYTTDNMNPLDKLLTSATENGLTAEIKRKDEHGQLHTASSSELASLGKHRLSNFQIKTVGNDKSVFKGTKARIASTAQLLQRLSPKQKLEWALCVKEEGNALYREKKYKDAMDKVVARYSSF